MSNHRKISWSTICLALFGSVAPGQVPKPVTPDGGRSISVHRIPIYDASGEKISLDDDPLLPFSPRQTCGQCHDYAKIHNGWHFNYQNPKVDPGRPGEPWILYDRATGTQLPLSYRPWPGTWRPDQAGLSDWLFTRAFGGHLPGGGVGEPAQPDPVKEPRWFVAGKLEINCLLCHSVDQEQDGSEWAVQVSRQNLMWAPTAASGMGVVKGSTAKLSDSFDPTMETNDETRGPRIKYLSSKFREDGTFLFKLRRRPDPGRCYQCHSTRIRGHEKWESDPDIHMTKGMHCLDCHRNGEDHNITRGDRGAYSCRECHLENGNLGAPRPRHAGLPPLHLDKMTCTACHAGPYPEGRARLTQTSRSHRMGVQGGYRGPEAPPYIFSPVFKPTGPAGPMAPHRVIYPSYWGRVLPDTDETTRSNIKPLSHFQVRKRGGKLCLPEPLATRTPSGWPGANELCRENFMGVLKRLATGKGEALFFTGGTKAGLDKEGKLTTSHSPARAVATSYAWPIGHPVRPARQSLGSGGCTDCHRQDAPFFYGMVPQQVCKTLGKGSGNHPMYRFQGLAPEHLSTLHLSFQGRTLFKIFGFTVAGILALILLHFTLRGIGALLTRNREGGRA